MNPAKGAAVNAARSRTRSIGINRAFERFRFGYRVEDGEVRKIASPAWEKAVVGPPLLAVQQPGWEEVDRAFREALEHQRARETDDALAAVNDAIVASLNRRPA